MAAQLNFEPETSRGWDMRTIRGLSLTRPWPFAFVHSTPDVEAKRVENRTWPPPHFIIGSYIALHAAKSWSEDDREWIEHITGLSVPKKTDCPHSQIFAVCRVTGFVSGGIDGLKKLPVNQGVWYFGEYGWQLDDFVELVEPVACSGGLGLWKFDERPAELHALRASYQKSVAAGVFAK